MDNLYTIYDGLILAILLAAGIVKPRVHNNKSVQLPYGFYTRNLDRMM